MAEDKVRPVVAVLAVVVQAGRILLVRRANPPDAGLWGFPGGKVEFGETIADAALREPSDRLDEASRLFTRQPGSRLVQKQDLGAAGDGGRDLEESPLTVRQ